MDIMKLTREELEVILESLEDTKSKTFDTGKRVEILLIQAQIQTTIQNKTKTFTVPLTR